MFVCVCKRFDRRISAAERGVGTESCRRKNCSDFEGTVSWVLTTVMESHNDEMAVLINPLSLYIVVGSSGNFHRALD